MVCMERFFNSERVAMYCSLEATEGVSDPAKGMPIVYSLIQNAAGLATALADCPARNVAPSSVDAAARSVPSPAIRTTTSTPSTSGW